MRWVLAFIVLAAGLGCSSVGSSVVRTDGSVPRPNLGAVRVYAIAAPPNTRVIGMVEVHAYESEANIDALIPVFVRRVAEVGGSGGVIDHVVTGYELRTDWRVESFSYPCGFHLMCFGNRTLPVTYQVRFLRILGRSLVPASAEPPELER